MQVEEARFDVFESIKKHISLLKPTIPKKNLICIGEYPSKILMKGGLAEKIQNAMPLFIGKSSKEIVKWSQSEISSDMILGLDTRTETHYWYNVLSFTTKSDAFVARLREKAIREQFDALVLSSSWEGIGSALAPFLTATLRESDTNAIAITILPSSLQSSDFHFNALYFVGQSYAQDLSTTILLDRDLLEAFTGVDRNGSVINGNLAFNYFLDIMLTQDSFVQELSELSKAFNVKLYTIISATGASLKLYESLENILDTSLFRPLLRFDLSSCSLLYVLIRMPEQLKERLPKGRIELSIAAWFKEKANLSSVYVSEPIYVDEMSDRIDVVLIVGGFNVMSMAASMEKRVKDVKNNAVKKGLIKEDDWQSIVGRIVRE